MDDFKQQCVAILLILHHYRNKWIQKTTLRAMKGSVSPPRDCSDFGTGIYLQRWLVSEAMRRYVETSPMQHQPLYTDTPLPNNKRQGNLFIHYNSLIICYLFDWRPSTMVAV